MAAAEMFSFPLFYQPRFPRFYQPRFYQPRFLMQIVSHARTGTSSTARPSSTASSSVTQHGHAVNCVHPQRSCIHPAVSTSNVLAKVFMHPCRGSSTSNMLAFMHPPRSSSIGGHPSLTIQNASTCYSCIHTDGGFTSNHKRSPMDVELQS